MKVRLLFWALLVVGIVVSPACDKASPVAPAGTTITLSVNPTRINITGQATVTAIVRRENGSPVNPGTVINFSTTLGELDPDDAATDDTGVAETILRGAGQIGTATVSASTGAVGAVTAELQIGSLASSMTLQASPTTIGKTGGEIDLLAVVRDDAGQLLENLAINFSTSAGTLESKGGPMLTNELGEARDILTVDQVDVIALDTGLITVSAFAATAEGASLLETTTDIPVRGLSSFISLQVTPGSVPPGGTGDNPLELLALVKDDIGLGVARAPVNFTTDAGSLGSGGAVILADANGQARDTLSLTEQDVSALGTRSFRVEAETIDNTGSPLRAFFQVSINIGAPIADFTFQVSVRTVSFLNSSTGAGNLNYAWDFGDGSDPPYRFDKNPTHTYIVGPQTYNVTLTVTNDFGTDSVQKPVPIED